MNDYSVARITDALEHARNTGRLPITKINKEPTARHEESVIAVTTTDAEGEVAETIITLEVDGRGIWMVEGATAELRKSIREIAERAIA